MNLASADSRAKALRLGSLRRPSPPIPLLPLARGQRWPGRNVGHRLRLRRFCRSRTTRLLLLLFVLFNLIQAWRTRRRFDVGNGHPEARRRAERVYIASMHWNNGDILKRHWNDAVVQLPVQPQTLVRRW